MRVAIVGGDAHTTCSHFCGPLHTIDKDVGPIIGVIYTGGQLRDTPR